MTNWQVLQFSGDGNFDNEADARGMALVLVLPRSEEGPERPEELAPSCVSEPCSAKRTSLRAATSMSSRASSLAIPLYSHCVALNSVENTTRNAKAWHKPRDDHVLSEAAIKPIAH